MTKELSHLTHRVSFLEEENRWLKSQLFGRSSEKRPWLDKMADAVLPFGSMEQALALPRSSANPDIGRKHWLFSQTTAGATASARLHSLVESAKANGIEPHAYLSRLFAELPKATSADHFESLLPWNIDSATVSARSTT